MLEKNLLENAEIIDHDKLSKDYLVLRIPVSDKYDTTILYHIHRDHKDYEATMKAVSGLK
jgi:hypothetical protein